MQNLFNFCKAESHEDVISLIEEGSQIETKYDIIEGELFKLYLPKTLDLLAEKLPLITAHSDTVFDEEEYLKELLNA